ncbi:MAG: hypothetical protein AUG16_03705 [Thaumarchaeota archaeon 13_1_20CM_2_39_20]|nr:MAG: hypothetical protein AUI59_03370 [Thaumarchaeota archaeon 13_1_40CM_2_39_13_1]OLE40497.1 MAG: hypothetical protein AUG16_03705 [Thaumarchaeota archaeon 13_1_20CM_2_39_20]
MDYSIDFGSYFLIILYPVVGLLIIEMACRGAKISNWIKLLSQAVMCVGFGIAYLTMHVAHWLTAGVLLALAIALFYQSKVSKLNPEKALY